MDKYVGARYMPKFSNSPYDPTTEYEALTVVDNGMGTSYVSNRPVPAGIPLSNTDYWAIYGAANGAIINLQNQINQLKDGFVTMDMFDAVGDGVTDDTAAVLAALTSGSSVVGDPSKTYLVSDGLEISTSDIVIANLHIKADCANNNSTDFYGACLKFTGDNLTFMGFKISGKYNHGLVITGNNVLVLESDFTGTQPDTVTPPEPAGTSSKPIIALDVHGINVIVEGCKFHDILNNGANVARGLRFAGHFSKCVVSNSIFDTITAYEDGDALQFLNEYKEHTESAAINCSFYKCSKRCIKIQARGVTIDRAYYNDVGLYPSTSPSECILALFESDTIVKDSYLATDSVRINIIISSLEAPGETYEHCTISGNVLINQMGDQTGIIQTQHTYSDIKVIDNTIIGAHDTSLGGGTVSYNTAFKIGQNSSADKILIAGNEIDCGRMFDDFSTSVLGSFVIVDNTLKADFGIMHDAATNGYGVVIGNNWYDYYAVNSNYQQQTLVSRYLTNVVADNNNVPSGYRSYMPTVGPSTRRPTENIYDGYMFVDTTLNKPLWNIGGSWYDATGTIIT